MISSIDHIVLTASDLDKTIAFYCDVLGMTLEDFTPSDGGEVRKSFKFGNQKINLHNAKSPFKPHANNPVSGSVDICFLSSKTIEEWHKIFSEKKVAGLEQFIVTMATPVDFPKMNLDFLQPMINKLK